MIGARSELALLDFPASNREDRRNENHEDSNDR